MLSTTSSTPMSWQKRILLSLLLLLVLAGVGAAIVYSGGLALIPVVAGLEAVLAAEGAAIAIGAALWLFVETIFGIHHLGDKAGRAEAALAASKTNDDEDVFPLQPALQFSPPLLGGLDGELNGGAGPVAEPSRKPQSGLK